MNLLIWGGDSWANQGDDAVLGGTIASLQEVLPEAHIVVASDRPDQTHATHRIAVVRRFSPAFLLALARCDLLIWGGGLLIQNHSSKAFLILQLALLTLARALRKRVICFGQGVGPVQGRFFRGRLQHELHRLALITVRDAASARRLTGLGVSPHRIHVLADPTFCLAAAGYPDEVLGLGLGARPKTGGAGFHPAQTGWKPVLPRSDAPFSAGLLDRVGVQQPFIAVALRRWGHYRSAWLPIGWTDAFRVPGFEFRVSGAASNPKLETLVSKHPARRGIAHGLDELRERLAVQILFIPMSPGGDQGDDHLAAEILRCMTNRSGSAILHQRLPPALLKAVLGRAEMVIAMRAHAGLLAADAGTPVLSISYQGKGRGLMEQLGMPEYCIPWRELCEERLVQAALQLWADREHVRVTLGRRLPELRAKAWAQADMVAHLVAGDAPQYDVVRRAHHQA